MARHRPSRPLGVGRPQPRRFRTGTGHGLFGALASGAHARSGVTAKSERAPALGDGAPRGAGPTAVLRFQRPRERPARTRSWVWVTRCSYGAARHTRGTGLGSAKRKCSTHGRPAAGRAPWTAGGGWGAWLVTRDLGQRKDPALGSARRSSLGSSPVARYVGPTVWALWAGTKKQDDSFSLGLLGTSTG